MDLKKINLVSLNAEELVSIDGGRRRGRLPIGVRRPSPITEKIGKIVMDFLEDIFD